MGVGENPTEAEQEGGRAFRTACVVPWGSEEVCVTVRNLDRIDRVTPCPGGSGSGVLSVQAHLRKAREPGRKLETTHVSVLTALPKCSSRTATLLLMQPSGF